MVRWWQRGRYDSSKVRQGKASGHWGSEVAVSLVVMDVGGGERRVIRNH